MTAEIPGKTCCTPVPESATRCSTANFRKHSNRQPENLVKIIGGTFQMGSNSAPHPEDGEGPMRPVQIDNFQLAACATTNYEFALFVEETGYQTDAEIAGGAFVFDPHGERSGQQLSHAPWWHYLSGANWQNPYANDQPIEPDYPVVHISHNDASVYANWIGARLPTEAEWEYAARGGIKGCQFPWGDELMPAGEHRCNVWQGEFPSYNSEEDGFRHVAPVDHYEPNGFGLYNMTGNVWEWVSDRFARLHSPKLQINPKGPLSGERFVMKGGSFLCHDSYCTRYRTSSRSANLPNACAVHIGFRVAI